MKCAAAATALVLFGAPPAQTQARPDTPSNDAAPKATPNTARRVASGTMMGSFNSYGSLLYAASDVTIHTDDADIGTSHLQSFTPDFYKPTISELLDSIARQTKSSWRGTCQWF